MGFDILSEVPQDSIITSAVLRLYMNRTVFGAADFTLHRITSDWGEAGSSNPLGEGAAALPGDATWSNTFFNTGTWVSAGADFVMSTASVQTVNGNGFYSWESTQMVDNVQEWINAPTNNYGWILIGDEANLFTAKRFDSRESATTARRPLLHVGFVPPPDLEIMKSASVNPVIAGSNITYSVTVSNRGPRIATGVTVTDPLSDDLSPLSGIADTNVGALAVGAWTTLVYSASVASDALNAISNSASVTSDTIDPIPDNDRASIVTTVATICNLSINKQAAGPGIIGQTAVQVLTVSNAGPSDARNVHVLDTLPECVFFLSASAAGGSVFSGGSVDCSLGTISAGTSASALVRVEYLIDGTYTNTATVTTDTTDITPLNNTTQAVTRIAAGGLFYAGGTTYGPENLGGGADGALVVTNSWKVDSVRSALISNAASGSSDISLIDASGFSIGDEILLLVAQGVSTNVGCYEFAFIQGLDGDTATLNNELKHSYDVAGSVVSVQRVPHYTSVTVLSNGVLTASEWNGVNGGGVVFRVAGTLDIQAGGSLSADGIGFRGGPGVQSNNETWIRPDASGWQGESFAGPGSQDNTNANFGGGGAGLYETNTFPGGDMGAGGGGASHASQGTQGEDDFNALLDDAGGRPGLTYGVSSLEKPLFGSGGGSGGHDEDNVSPDVFTATAGTGGSGGGLVFIVANSLNLAGTLSARGDDGHDAIADDPIDDAGGGGGGAGGSMLVLLVNTNGNTGTTSVGGGAKGLGGRQSISIHQDGGSGGEGRVVSATVKQADLAITKTAPPGPHLLDEDLVYSLSITNHGPSDASGVIVADFLPAGATFLTVTSDLFQCTFSNDVVRCDTGTNAITAGGSAWVEILVNLSTTTILTNKVILASTMTLDPNASNNLSSVETTVLPTADLHTFKTASAESVVAGSNLVYTLVVSNTGPREASQVLLSDALPQGLQVVTGSTNVPAGSLPAGGWTSVVIEVSIDSGALGTVTNIATASSDTEDPVPTNDQASVETTITAEADLSVLKAASVNPVLAGSNMVYSITVSNAGPSDARGVVVVDTLPVGLSPSGPVTNLLGTLSAGASQVILVPVSVLSGASGPITNMVIVSADTTDPGSSNNTESVVTDILSLADLRVSKSASLSNVLAGSNMTYIVTVTNRGPSLATSVVLADLLPDEVDLLQGVTNVFAGSLEPGATTSVVIEVGVKADALGGMTNHAFVSNNTTDPDTSNNAADVETTITAFAHLIISKHASVDTVIAGSNMIYTIVVSNAGPSVARDVVVIDAIPAVLSPSGLVTNALGDLDPGGASSYTIAVTVSSTASGNVTNVATVSSATDGPPGTNTAVEVTDIIRLADLGITKAASANPVIAGSNLVYTISATNRGPSQAQNVVIADALPGPITLLSGQTNVFIDDLDVGAHTTLVITVSVPEDLVGSLTNTASIISSATDPVPTNNTDIEVTSILLVADLGISKSPSTNVAIAGAPLHYFLTVSNAGPSLARNVMVTDFLPPSVSPSGVIVTNLGAIASGATTTFSIPVTVLPDLPTGSVLTNAATVSGDAHDASTGNNLTTELTGVLSQADLRVSKRDSVDPVTLSESLNYIIDITNTGPSRAWNVVVTDTLPPGLTPTGSVVSNIGSIPPASGTSLVIAVLVHTNTTGTITNRAEVSSTSTDTNTADNVALEETTIPDFDADGEADFSDEDDDDDGIPDGFETQHGFDPKDDQDADDDSDMDMFSNLEEYIADTDPTNALSFFNLDALVITNSTLILFDSSTGRIYTLEYVDDLVNGFFTNEPGHLQKTGIGGPDSFLDTNEAPARFYRIEVEIP